MAEHRYIRLFFGAGATLLLLFALLRFFDPAGLSSQDYWWLIIVAFALGVVGFSLRTEWQMAGLSTATFMIGFGAQLALKDPLWFQSLQLQPKSNFSYLLMTAPLMQGAFALFVLNQNDAFKNIGTVLSSFGWVKLALVFLVLCGGSMGAMDYVRTYNFGGLVEQLIVASSFLVLNLLSFIAFVIALPSHPLSSISKSTSQVISLPGSSDQVREYDQVFLKALAGAVLIICVFMRVVVFDNVPRIDEASYFVHAKYFSQGLLTLPLPPAMEAFDLFLMNTYEDKWFATWPPGWPFMLAIGIFFKVPWLINPLLAALSILIFHFIIRSLLDRGTANLATLLLAISPWYISASSSLMPHTATYFLILGAWALLIKAQQRPTLMAPLIAGGALGLVFLTRPLDGVLMGTLTGLGTLTFIKAPGQWKTPIIFGVGCLLIGGLIFPYNILLTGDPLQIPLNVYFDMLWGEGANRIGFGPDVGPKDWGSVDPFPGHSPFEALVQAQQMFYSLNFEFLGWGIGSLSFVLIFMLWGKWSKLNIGLATIVILTICIHALYWYAASFYVGPRYWFLALIPMVIFATQGIIITYQKLSSAFPNKLVPERIGAGIGLLCLCSVFIFVNWLGFNKYPGFREDHGEYRTLANQPELTNSLIFLSSEPSEEFENAIWLNDFTLKSDTPLFVRDISPEINRQVASAYPERKIYFVQGHTKELKQVRITRGPLTLEEIK